MALSESPYPYTAHYCEENVWQAARHPDFQEHLVYTSAVMISNAIRQCPLWAQRASLVYGNPVVWDYHVILMIAQPGKVVMVWDFDTLLGAPVPFESWWTTSFPFLEHLTPTYQPMFRVIPAAQYIDVLSSDRRHMKDEKGNWRMPPPSWPANFDGYHNLPELIDMSQSEPGIVLDHHRFHDMFHSS